MQLVPVFKGAVQMSTFTTESAVTVFFDSSSADASSKPILCS